MRAAYPSSVLADLGLKPSVETPVRALGYTRNIYTYFSFSRWFIQICEFNVFNSMATASTAWIRSNRDFNLRQNIFIIIMADSWDIISMVIIFTSLVFSILIAIPITTSSGVDWLLSRKIAVNHINKNAKYSVTLLFIRQSAFCCGFYDNARVEDDELCGWLRYKIAFRNWFVVILYQKPACRQWIDDILYWYHCFTWP